MRNAPMATYASRSYAWGLNERYYVDSCGIVEEIDSESPPQTGIVPTFVADELIRLAGERERIRAELIDWLTVQPTHTVPGSINGRCIVDEIDRICPKE